MESNFVSNKIKNIKLENNDYTIQIPIQEQYIESLEKSSVVLKSRDKQEAIDLNLNYLNSTGCYRIYEVTIPFNTLKNKLFKKNIWDMYIVQENSEIEAKQIRIKSDCYNIHFLSTIVPTQKKVFYPYVTNQGGLSFKVNDYAMISEVESVKISKKNILFYGYFNFPPFYRTNQYKVNKATLWAVDSLTNEETEVPIELFKRGDLLPGQHLDENIMFGIKGKLNLKSHLTDNKELRFFLKVCFEKTDGLLEEYKTKINLTCFSYEKLSSIIFNKYKKYKIYVKQSKKSKAFTVQIRHFNIKKVIIKKVRYRWQKARRGNKLKKLYKIAFKILGKLPVRKNLIVFESFLGKQYSDSPRAIYEYMLENNLNDRMYWSFDRRHINYFKDREIRAVRRFSIKWLFLMARANYWISNSRLPLWLPKPSHTIYVQTWHGTPLKKLAADMEQVQMPGTNTKKYKRNFLKEASKWDYLVSPNNYSTQIFKRAFGFKGIMIESGYPRNDILINSNNKENITEIKKKIKIPINKKVILYAPTWRDNQFYEKGKYKFNLKMDIDKLRKELENDYIIILRLHYLVAENLDLKGYEGFIYDLSKYEDIRELYLISDVLITDYSSVFFDYANLKRPMIFYVYDIEDYRDNLRGFYFDFEKKAPGPLVKSTDEILEEINIINKDGFVPSDNFREFYKKFCYLEDGKATERVVKEFFN